MRSCDYAAAREGAPPVNRDSTHPWTKTEDDKAPTPHLGACWTIIPLFVQ